MMEVYQSVTKRIFDSFEPSKTRPEMCSCISGAQDWSVRKRKVDAGVQLIGVGVLLYPRPRLKGISPRYTLGMNTILVNEVAYAKNCRRLPLIIPLFMAVPTIARAIRGCHESIQ